MALINRQIDLPEGRSPEHVAIVVTSMDRDIAQAGRLLAVALEFILYPEDNGDADGDFPLDAAAMVDAVIIVMGQVGRNLDALRAALGLDAQLANAAGVATVRPEMVQ